MASRTVGVTSSRVSIIPLPREFPTIGLAWVIQISEIVQSIAKCNRLQAESSILRQTILLAVGDDPTVDASDGNLDDPVSRSSKTAISGSTAVIEVYTIDCFDPISSCNLRKLHMIFFAGLMQPQWHL
jgi:hypothetical protein